ncbi:type II secretion system F family protein [Clostridium niameyense]|uniref:Type II secretion system F family protein n=1 Tax=Clostridium niameyense TaxID=1622073 RepID=A0A6M0R8J1_9CLOT|nr:type II secretion system F family protein [Clostridium niameyense]NEZ46561.1 type II secretion system F family protein [Clostridium niameyense]
MANFKYKIMNKNGERLEGIYKAKDKDEVLSMIKSNNYYPLRVQPLSKEKNLKIKWMTKVKIKDIAIFCRQFYTMINAGSNITNSLNVLGEQLTNKRLKGSMFSIEENIRKGLNLSEAMRKEEEVFPDLLISMVQAGEVSGNLEVVMRRMAEHYEKENKINNKVKAAMVYPIMLAILSLGLITLILTFVMPIFIGMFDDNNVELPIATKIMMSISNILKTKWYIVLSIILLIVFLLKYYFKTKRGEIILNRIKLNFPILKKINEKIIVSRFTRTLSTVLASGITLVEGLEVVSKIIGNKIIENKIIQVKEEVVKGAGLAQPLYKTGYFPPMLSSMVKIGEESGSLDYILNKTADFYDDELEAYIQQFTSMLEPIMILIMGVIIGFMIIAIVLPVFDIYNHIQ